MIANGYAHPFEFSRCAKPAFTPALLISLVVHAAVGGVVLQGWRMAAVESPRPLTVMLEAVPPIEVDSPRAVPADHTHEMPFRKSRALPVQHAPVPSVIAVERVDAAPVLAVPVAVAEVPPVPVVVAKASVAANAPVRQDAIEPPHFNVAYLNNPRPAYPPIARKLGVEGVVLLRVDVSAKGTPEKIVIAQTSGASSLDEAAMKAVQGWTFVPARRGDTPVAHPVEVPIRFQLKN